jgi:3'(2'), 5'-bisphosphate nucleotidase
MIVKPRGLWCGQRLQFCADSTIHGVCWFVDKIFRLSHVASMNLSRYAKEKEVTIQAVLQASDLARKMQGKLAALDVVNKEDLSPVTITDFSVQALINMRLMHEFPKDEIMGEEDALFLRNPQHQVIKEKVIEQIEFIFPGTPEEAILDAIDRGGSQGGGKGRFWVLDPIDGTRGFIQQEPYAIALALIEDSVIVMGILGCPRFAIEGHKGGGLFVAVRGEGTILIPYDTLEHIPLHVRPSQEIIYCEPHSISQTHSHSAAFEVAKKIKAHPHPFRLDSQCKYAHVAIGDAAIYLRIPTPLAHDEKIWDHAAGTIVVEEAGGRVSDMDGKPLDFSCGTGLSKNKGIVATNGFIHDQVISAIQSLSL